MWAKVVDTWGYMHWWEQSLLVLFGVWLTLEFMRDAWPGLGPYIVSWMSRLWKGRR